MSAWGLIGPSVRKKQNNSGVDWQLVIMIKKSCSVCFGVDEDSGRMLKEQRAVSTSCHFTRNYGIDTSKYYLYICCIPCCELPAIISGECSVCTININVFFKINSLDLDAVMFV